MVQTSGDGGALAWFDAASDGSAPSLTPRFLCGEAASDAYTARRRQQASQPSRRACRPSCKTQLGRAPEKQHQLQTGVCDDEERSSRRSGARTMRRPERHSRGAQLASWCRSPDMSAVWAAERSGSRTISFCFVARRTADGSCRPESERRRGGTSRRSDFGEPGAQPVQQLKAQSAAAAAASCQRQRHEDVRVERWV